MKRKPIPDSIRWEVFRRDGYCCRYCGIGAGENGVSLAVDHVVSVAEGGTNDITNLVAACRSCNGGKGARSLASAPAPSEVVDRIDAKRKTMEALAESIRAAAASQKATYQSIVNMKCEAYGKDSIRFQNHEIARVTKLCQEFGADRVAEWYGIAARQRVSDWSAIQYICGIAKNVRLESE